MKKQFQMVTVMVFSMGCGDTVTSPAVDARIDALPSDAALVDNTVVDSGRDIGSDAPVLDGGRDAADSAIGSDAGGAIPVPGDLPPCENNGVRVSRRGQNGAISYLLVRCSWGEALGTGGYGAMLYLALRTGSTTYSIRGAALNHTGTNHNATDALSGATGGVTIRWRSMFTDTNLTLPGTSTIGATGAGASVVIPDTVINEQWCPPDNEYRCSRDVAFP